MAQHPVVAAHVLSKDPAPHTSAPHPEQTTKQQTAGSTLSQIRTMKDTLISGGVFTKIEVDHMFEQVMKELNIKMQYPLSI